MLKREKFETSKYIRRTMFLLWEQAKFKVDGFFEAKAPIQFIEGWLIKYLCLANWSFLIAYCVVHNRKEEIGCKSNFCKQNFSKSNRIFVCSLSFTIHIRLDLAQLFHKSKLVHKLSSRNWRCAMKLLPDFSYIQSRIWLSEAWELSLRPSSIWTFLSKVDQNL